MFAAPPSSVMAGHDGARCGDGHFAAPPGVVYFAKSAP